MTDSSEIVADIVLSTDPPAEPAPVIQTAGGTIPRQISPRLLVHGGIAIPHYFGMHVTGACFPLVAALLLYGWRAMISIAVILLTTAIAIAIWRRIGRRGEQLRYAHGLWLGLLLALTLPPHLLTGSYFLRGQSIIAWPVLPAAALVMVPLIWLGGGLGSGKIHPVILTQLLLMLLFHDLLVPHLSLQRHKIFVGDVMDAGDPAHVEPLHGAWMSAANVPGRDAIRAEPASLRLNFYTSGFERSEQPYAYLSMEALLRDRMPPLEDLIVGGHPGPMGTGCAVAVIIGGLFMLYRGVIDYRVPLLIVIGAYTAFMVLPVPIAIRQFSREWHWMAFRQPSVGAPLAVTFANYEMMASPMLFVAFFLATSPAVRPLTRRSRILYALLIGVLAAALQLYSSVAAGPYLALLIVGAITPLLDRMFRPHTLV